MVKLAQEITIVSIEILVKAINKAKLGMREKKEAINRLNRVMVVKLRLKFETSAGSGFAFPEPSRFKIVRTES